MSRQGTEENDEQEQEPSAVVAPNWSAVALLHRSIDARIPTYRKEEDRIMPVASIPTGHLHQFAKYPDSIQDPAATSYSFDLRTDGYFTINSMSCYQQYKRPIHEPFPRRNVFGWDVARRKDWVRYLNACYVDIDCYSQGITTGQVTGQVDDMVIARALPQPTIRCYSGRGVWYLWLLYDDEPKTAIVNIVQDEGGKKHFVTDWHRWPDGWRRLYDPEHYPPIRAWSDRVRRWEAVQQAIFNRLEFLGADRSVTTDSSRIMRFPGSWNSKAGQEVRFQEVGIRNGHVIVYSLVELEDAFGINQAPVSKSYQGRRNTDKDQKSVAGWRALQDIRIRQFQFLGQLRAGSGGFKKGTRSAGALFLAYHLATNGIALPDIEQAVLGYGRNYCYPSLPDRLCRKKVAEAMELKAKRWKWTNERIVAEFQITEDEQAALGKKFGKSGWCKAKYRAGRNLSATERRTAIQGIVARRGRLSLRKMIKALAERDITVSIRTVRNDYIALGL